VRAVTIAAVFALCALARTGEASAVGGCRVQAWLGGTDWCYEDEAVAHDDHACERFASSLAWAYWPWRRNVMSWEAVVPAGEFRERFAALLERQEARLATRVLSRTRSSLTLRQAS
jgi:hypothetical protein